METEAVLEKWNQLNQLIEDYIPEPRKTQLKQLYEELAERMICAPASSDIKYHNCFPGGYIDHVVRVVHCAINEYNMWNSTSQSLNGFNLVSNISIESVVFAALNHDLGKIGDLNGNDYYIDNDNDWLKKKGKLYKVNPKLNHMEVPERSIFILQSRGIMISEEEFLSIKLHDGLYSDANKFYFMPGNTDHDLKTLLPIVLHHADHLATLIEKNRYKVQPSAQETIVDIPKRKVNKLLSGVDTSTPVDMTELEDLFKDI